MGQNINASGHLDAGKGHKIYWEDWGNPKATPIIHLHGGPGAGFNELHKVIYDPSKHRVIFHDQRGCGKSRPTGELNNNSTQDLINDIELLRNHLGLDKVHLAGGSWGSCLALLYAIAFPGNVMNLMIWSIFLGRKADSDYMYGSPARYYLPEAWERFINNVPVDKRESPDKVMLFYFEKMNSADVKQAQKYADEWALWDTSLVVPKSDWATLLERVPGDSDSLIMGKLHLYYCLNGNFIPENFLLENVNKITGIKCFAVHGRFDYCTPPVNAHELSKAYGGKLKLKMVNSSHLRNEPEMQDSLKAIASSHLI